MNPSPQPTLFRPSAQITARTLEAPLARSEPAATPTALARLDPAAPQPKEDHRHSGSILPGSREAIHAAIALKAYDIWERDGRPNCRAEATWLEAEKDLLAAQKWSQSETVLPVSF